VTTTGATLAATISETGAIYAVVVPQSEATPSITQVKAGQDSGGNAADASASATATTSLSQAVTGLVEDTAYKAVFVAQDDETTPNVQASVTVVNFSTVAEVDNTPPSFVIAPAVSQVTQTTCLLNASINEAGSIYWVVIPASYPDPQPAEIISNQIVSPSSEIVAAEAAGSGSPITDYQVTGLQAGTQYKAAFAAQDADSNAQLTSTIVTFTTSLATTTRSLTDTLKDRDTGAVVANTNLDYQIQAVWGGSVLDSGNITTDANGQFTLSNLNVAAGQARIFFTDTATGLKFAGSLVTIVEV